MPTTVSGAALVRAQLQDVPPGRLFILESGEGPLICMASSRAAVVVLGGPGQPGGDRAAPGVFDPSYILDDEVHVLPEDAEIEVLPVAGGAFPLPVPVRNSANGSVFIDSAGQGWIRAIGKRMGGIFSLVDGQQGDPGLDAGIYPTWRLIWRQPNVKEPVEILAWR